MAKRSKSANGLNNTANNIVNNPLLTEELDNDDVTSSNNASWDRAISSHKGEWFCTMLYTQEDPKHEAFLTYIVNTMQEYAYVLHDRDPITQHDVESKPKHYTSEMIGQIKKPHVHLVWKHYSKVTLLTVRKLFGCWQEQHGIKACTDYVSYLYYCTHQDPKSLSLGKAVYNWDEFTIVGKTLTKQLAPIQQKRNFVQYKEECEIARQLMEAGCDTMFQAYEYLCKNNIQTNLSAFQIKQIVSDVQYINRRQDYYRIAAGFNRKDKPNGI